MRTIEVLKNRCKIKLFVSTFCIGVELNQFFPKFVDVVVGEQIVKRYKDPGLYMVDKINFQKENAFSKQKLNYESRARKRF
jgi:hypothetical protein